MPGTGHSARYKGSISNRSKISPFEHLAKWNQQLLGADGAVPSIVGGNSLEFKKLDATNIAGVMHNPAIADLNMNNFRITNVTNISNGGGAMQLSSSGNLFITSASEVQIQPSSGANIVLECANTGGSGDIILRWPDTVLNHTIKIGNNNTNGGNKQVLIMADNTSVGTNSLYMGSGSLQLASLNSLTTTIAGQNTMAISGPNITIGGGAQVSQINIGNNNCDGVNIVGNSNLNQGVTIGVGVQSIKMGENAVGLPQGIHIGTSSTSSKIRFFDTLEPWGRRAVRYPVSITTSGTSITDLSNATVDMSSNAFGTDLKRQIIMNYNTLYCLLRALDRHVVTGTGLVTEGGLGLIEQAPINDTCVDLVGDGVNPIPVPP